VALHRAPLPTEMACSRCGMENPTELPP
jgi:hypothetical protein